VVKLGVFEIAVIYLLAKDLLSSKVGARIGILAKEGFKTMVDKGDEVAAKRAATEVS
jgi:hypothetical protein